MLFDPHLCPHCGGRAAYIVEVVLCDTPIRARVYEDEPEEYLEELPEDLAKELDRPYDYDTNTASEVDWDTSEWELENDKVSLRCGSCRKSWTALPIEEAGIHEDSREHDGIQS